MSEECSKCESEDIRFTHYFSPTNNVADCCGFRYADLADCFPDTTVFDRVTASPEMLAAESVYAHENCRIPDGATSPFIDTIFWFDDEEGDTWDERFDSAWKKAIAATVERLKEVSK